MNARLEKIREELERDRQILEDLNKQGYMGRKLFDIMTHMFDLIREEEILLKQHRLF